MAVVGIDLGTTFSLIGQLNSTGMPSLFPDLHDASQFRTPSLVHFEGANALVGQTVEDLLEEEPGLDVLRFIKLKMGTDEILYTDSKGRDWTARALSALILKKLIRDAEMVMTEPADQAVIAVPANFDDRQRQHTKDAGLMAGFKSVALIDEPVAAATFYGQDKAAEDTTLFVYDLGGGTFDATVLQASPDGLFVLSTAGSNDIGGCNVDGLLMDFLAAAFEREHGKNLLQDPATKRQLRVLAEDLKIKLSKPGRTQIRQMSLLGGAPFEFFITRTQFEKLLEPLLEKTYEVCQTCLESSGLDWRDMDAVMLTGGSTMTPRVREFMLEKTGISSHKLLHQQAHQAVGYGVATIAGQRNGSSTANGPKQIRNVASHDICMHTFNKKSNSMVLSPLLKRNTPLPTEIEKLFYTTRDDQTRLVFELVLRRSLGDSESLGHFAFGPIPNPRKNYPVEVTLRCDAEGLLKVTACDPQSGLELSRVFSDQKDTEAARYTHESDLVSSTKVN